MTEDPVLTVDLSLTEIEKAEHLLVKFSKLSSRSKSSVEQLYDYDPEAEESLKVVRVFKCNSIQGILY